MQATFFDGKPFTASITTGTQFKMIFTADGKMTRQPRGKSGMHRSRAKFINAAVTMRRGWRTATRWH
jgi:hypothetical protein